MIATSDNIFVSPIVEKEGNIHIPPVFRRKNQITMKGIVKYAGPNAILKEGDSVVFNKWQDNEIVVGGEKLLLIKPFHILAIQ